MSLLIIDKTNNISVVTLNRGKVNAINDELISELHKTLRDLENDDNCRCLILTGKGSFFSFGFDIPELLSYNREKFLGYLQKFNEFIKYLFLYPKPLVVSINGHCIAGGCVMSLASDYRIMVNGKSKIALNEIGFGSTLFSSAMELLKYVTGHRNAETILLSGELYKSEQAMKMGLVDEICIKDDLYNRSLEVAKGYSQKDPDAFSSLKRMARINTLENIKNYEFDSIREFVDIWYSEKTWESLKKIEIRS